MEDDVGEPVIAELEKDADAVGEEVNAVFEADDAADKVADPEVELVLLAELDGEGDTLAVVVYAD